MVNSLSQPALCSRLVHVLLGVKTTKMNKQKNPQNRKQPNNNNNKNSEGWGGRREKDSLQQGGERK